MKATGHFALQVVLWVAILWIPVSHMPLTEIVDPDIWWHLRTGEWIVQHGKLPSTDPFSAFGEGKPWIAYSWLYEVLVYGLHQAFGLKAIPIYRFLLLLPLALLLHGLISRRLSHRYGAAGLSILVFLALRAEMSERPWLFSILFFTLTLAAVESLWNGASPRRLWWLPGIFALWANLHIQFIFGLVLLGIACYAPLVHSLLLPNEPPLLTPKPWKGLIGISVACLLATLLNPYHAFVYKTVYEYSQHGPALDLITEVRSLSFRRLGDWAVLALFAGAVFALGRRPRVTSFGIPLLAVAAFLSFRSGRDQWCVVVVSALLLARALGEGVVAEGGAVPFSKSFPALFAALAFLVPYWGHRTGLFDRGVVASPKVFPVEAAAYLEKAEYSGLVFNDLDWGGYLIWRLPKAKVAIDGRTNLHGDERLLQSERVWKRALGWQGDPDLAKARFVFAPAASPLVAQLQAGERFRRVYRDRVAVLFERQPFVSTLHLLR